MKLTLSRKQPTSLLHSEEFNCISKFLHWPGFRPGQAPSAWQVISSRVQKSFLVCFPFPPSANPAPPWLVLGWCWAWRKIPGTANISVNTFISMRIYIQFLCQNTVRKYSILPSEKEKINKYSKHCTVTKTFDETWFENSLLFYHSVILAFRNWHFSTSCKFLVQQNVNISPPAYP